MDYLVNETEETKQTVYEIVAVCKNINRIDETLLQRIVLKLIKLKCDVKVEDSFMLCELVDSVENEIKMFCNIDTIPDGCIPIEINMICGYFMKDKVSTGQQETETAIKSISIGDTSTSFSTSSNTTDTLIASLVDGGRKRLCQFRKVRW